MKILMYIKKKFSVSALTQIHEHQLKIYLSTKEKPEGAYCADLHEFKKMILSLKLPDDWQISDKQNYIFQRANLTKYPVQTYLFMRTWNLLFVYFPTVSH